MTHLGELDERIVILRNTPTTNEFNEPVESWSTLLTIWARKTDATMGETIRAAAVEAKITAHFVVRHSTETEAITPKDRISFEGKTYDITGIRELDERWLEFHAVARADQ